jgi:hypothetical protein
MYFPCVSELTQRYNQELPSTITDETQKSHIFWDIMTCGPLKVNGSFGGTYCLHLQGGKYVASRAETSVDFQWTTRRYILEHRIIHNLKF